MLAGSLHLLSEVSHFKNSVSGGEMDLYSPRASDTNEFTEYRSGKAIITDKYKIGVSLSLTAISIHMYYVIYETVSIQVLQTKCQLTST